jgi:hypothetical protein
VSEQQNPIIGACGLWAAKDGSKIVASGRWGDLKVLIFRNESTNEKAPQYRMCLTKWEDRKATGDQQRQPEQVEARRRGPAPAAVRDAMDEDDIPF